MQVALLLLGNVTGALVRKQRAYTMLGVTVGMQAAYTAAFAANCSHLLCMSQRVTSRHSCCTASTVSCQGYAQRNLQCINTPLSGRELLVHYHWQLAMCLSGLAFAVLCRQGGVLLC